MSSKQGRSVAKSWNRSAARLGRHLEKNLIAYAAAASAGLLSTALPAEGEIIYTPSNTPMTIAQRNNGVTFTPLDLNNDGVPDFTFAISSTAHFSSYGYTTRARFYLKVIPGQVGNEAVQGKQAPTASAVPAGVKIGPQEKFASGNLYLVNRTFNFSKSKTSQPTPPASPPSRSIPHPPASSTR